MKQVTVTWGEENFMPIKYNGFRVGPFAVTVNVGPDEDLGEVFKREYARLEKLAERTFVRKRNAFQLAVMSAKGDKE